MFESKLDNIRLMYGAEMDGIDSDVKVDLDNVDLNLLKFVEVKSRIRAHKPFQHDNFLKFKLRNWWCQSFLVNIKEVLVGVRDHRGIVDELQTFDLRTMTSMSKVH